MTKINEKLHGLYASKWEDIRETLLEIAHDDPAPEPTNPLLLYVDNEEEWTNADLRVMVFGQTTNDWEELGKSVEYLQNVYNGFFNEGECWSYGGAFWNGFARFKRILADKYPGKQIRYLWNDIIKIGLADNTDRPEKNGNIDKAECDFFHVIPDEVKILQPDMLLFLTGPDYADAIRRNFGEATSTAIPPYTEREVARLAIEQVRFAFRTYHPGYLWRKGIDSYFNAIVQEIKL
jgi:hypothetical protein